MKLLIVDDQRSVVQGLANCTDWGAVGFDCVATAYNAIDARASLLEREAEVMLCDIEMPEKIPPLKRSIKNLWPDLRNTWRKTPERKVTPASRQAVKAAIFLN